MATTFQAEVFVLQEDNWTPVDATGQSEVEVRAGIISRPGLSLDGVKATRTAPGWVEAESTSSGVYGFRFSDDDGADKFVFATNMKPIQDPAPSSASEEPTAAKPQPRPAASSEEPKHKPPPSSAEDDLLVRVDLKCRSSFVRLQGLEEGEEVAKLVVCLYDFDLTHLETIAGPTGRSPDGAVILDDETSQATLNLEIARKNVAHIVVAAVGAKPDEYLTECAGLRLSVGFDEGQTGDFPVKRPQGDPCNALGLCSVSRKREGWELLVFSQPLAPPHAETSIPAALNHVVNLLRWHHTDPRDAIAFSPEYRDLAAQFTIARLRWEDDEAVHHTGEEQLWCKSKLVGSQDVVWTQLRRGGEGEFELTIPEDQAHGTIRISLWVKNGMVYTTLLCKGFLGVQNLLRIPIVTERWLSLHDAHNHRVAEVQLRTQAELVEWERPATPTMLQSVAGTIGGVTGKVTRGLGGALSYALGYNADATDAAAPPADH